jgi:hypothetical protein
LYALARPTGALVYRLPVGLVDSAAGSRLCPGWPDCSWLPGRLRHMLLRDVLGDGGASYRDAASADLEWAVVIG